MAREIPESEVATMEALVKCGVVMVSIALAYQHHDLVIALQSNKRHPERKQRGAGDSSSRAFLLRFQYARTPLPAAMVRAFVFSNVSLQTAHASLKR
jgi:hypothetical protein